MLDVWELIWGCIITFIIAWCFSINVSVKVRTVLTGESLWRCIGLPMSYGLHLFPSVRFPGFYLSSRHYLIESDAPSHFCWWIRHWCLVSLKGHVAYVFYCVWKRSKTIFHDDPCLWHCIFWLFAKDGALFFLNCILLKDLYTVRTCLWCSF